MWIKSEIYNKLQTDLEVERRSRELLQNQITATNTMLDWFRVRLTQLEYERAQLIFNYTGVKIPTPVVEKAPLATGEEHKFNDLPNIFSDVGDKEAARLGIDWNNDGTISYKQ